jgi:hypothetical protein
MLAKNVYVRSNWLIMILFVHAVILMHAHYLPKVIPEVLGDDDQQLISHLCALIFL